MADVRGSYHIPWTIFMSTRTILLTLPKYQPIPRPITNPIFIASRRNYSDNKMSSLPGEHFEPRQTVRTCLSHALHRCWQLNTGHRWGLYSRPIKIPSSKSRPSSSRRRHHSSLLDETNRWARKTLYFRLRLRWSVRLRQRPVPLPLHLHLIRIAISI